MDNNNFNLVKQMHEKFKLDNPGNPQPLSHEEAMFRCKAMYEELMEYIDTTFIIDLEKENQIFDVWIRDVAFKVGYNLEDQFDALLDLAVFTMGTAERQGFNWNEGFNRVMQANIQKELAGSDENSKRGFKRDLVKPKGWIAPILTDLVQPIKGIIVLDGPDGCGKTTLAEKFQELYGAQILHLTWSPELENRMSDYMIGNIEEAIELSKTKLVIIDRCWMSEICYSEAFRNGTNWPLLHETCDRMLLNNNAYNVICMPNDPRRGIERFNKLKTERDEMYDSIDNVFDYYYAIYWGTQKGIVDNSFKSEYANMIINSGGLVRRNDFISYDFEMDGSDLKQYCASILREIQ